MQLKYIFLSLGILSSLLYSDNYYGYKLYDNKFQAVFPGDPELFLNTANVQSYMYADRKNSIGFLSKHIDYSAVKTDMTEFSQKSLEENLFYLPAKQESHKIISINSVKSNNKTYTFYVLKKFQSGGTTIYQYIKAILHNNHLYSCSLQYTNNAKNIFESYQNQCKFLN